MSKNDITGDKQATRPATDAYRDNYDKIFGGVIQPPLDPFDSVWNQWISFNTKFAPTNEEFARFFFNAGRNLK